MAAEHTGVHTLQARGDCGSASFEMRQSIQSIVRMEGIGLWRAKVEGFLKNQRHPHFFNRPLVFGISNDESCLHHQQFLRKSCSMLAMIYDS